MLMQKTNELDCDMLILPTLRKVRNAISLLLQESCQSHLQSPPLSFHQPFSKHISSLTYEAPP